MNKSTYLYYLAAFLIFSLVACKGKNITSNNDTIKFDGNGWSSGSNGPDVTINDTATIDTIPEVIALIDTIELDTVVVDSVIKKAVYEVAIILPFMEDSVRRAWSGSKAKNFQEMVISKESEYSTSFLEGTMMAFKDLELNSKFNIHVYDNNNSLSTTNSILSKFEAAQFDIIIGPMHKENIKVVSDYAIQEDIVHISPFSPSKTASQGNSKYYMFEPSLEQHLLAMIDYGMDSIENPHFKFFYPNSASSKSYADLISNYIDNLNLDRPLEDKINYSNIEITGKSTSFKLANYTDANAHNVIIVNSFDENFIHMFLRQVNQVSKNNDVTIFGMPGWESSQIVRLEYLSSANLHFTKSFWLDKEDPNVELFNDTYKTKYGTSPNEYAFLGYDMTAILFKLIDENGLNFNKQFVGYEFNGMAKKYLFKQVLTNENEVNRIENSKLRIYKIEDFEPILIR